MIVSQRQSKTTSKKVCCLIYPDNSLKTKWDAWIIMILIFIAVTLPYRLAFSDEDNLTWQIINTTVDISFLIDMVLTFFTAIQNENTGHIITDKRLVAKSYLKSWFFIDLVSIVPLDKILQDTKNRYNHIARFAKMSRFTKLSKLLRIVRMAKMFRICKDRKKIAQRVDTFVQLNANLERALTFLALGILFNHIMTCLWVLSAKVDEDNNWIHQYGLRMQAFGENFDDENDWTIYMISLYFVATTVTTVGYGDIVPVNGVERIFCHFIMLVGVLAFSFASGSLGSLITNYENSQASMKERLETLNKIKK
jgi:hypothetical protein